MTQSIVMQLARDAFTVTLMTAAPLLLVSIVVGVSRGPSSRPLRRFRR